MKSLIICFLSIVLFSCSGKTTLFGTYENKKGEKVIIDCDYRISSDKLEKGPFMPKNGTKIQLEVYEMNTVEFGLSFKMGDTLQSTFGTWNQKTGEMKINNVSYSQTEELPCGNE